MTLFPTDQSKDTLKTYAELQNKIKNLIKAITDNSDNYDEKHMKIKFNSDDDSRLKKTLELHDMVIVLGSVFHGGKKYYSQVSLDECFYKL